MGNSLPRYLSAMLLLLYGFAKINGSQFTVLDSQLDKPMGQVSGFWLTWYYFGYSAFYGNFIALTQIAGALLLTFRRTTLLGAALLAPILGNIVLIDIFYAIDFGATIVALFLLAVMIGLISARWQELRALFLPSAPQLKASRGETLATWAARCAMLVAAFGFTYWVANYNNRSPTPIDGTWEVIQKEGMFEARVPGTFYFEYNRANMAVFRFADGNSETNSFEVGSGRRLRMWGAWNPRAEKIFDGTYELAGSELRIQGAFRESGSGTLLLRKRAVR